MINERIIQEYYLKKRMGDLKKGLTLKQYARERDIQKRINLKAQVSAGKRLYEKTQRRLK